LTSHTHDSPPATRFRLGKHWAWVPVALLVSSALGVGGMAIVAIRDPHFATEPDYYQKAIRWDQTQAQAAENQRLGYEFALPAAIAFDAHGHATLELHVKDHSGQPVTGARLSAEAFANAYSGEMTQLVFSERAPGSYVAEFTARHPGVWVFRVGADSDHQHFTAVLRSVLQRDGAA